METPSEQPVFNFPVAMLVKTVWLVALVITCASIAHAGGDDRLAVQTVLVGGVVFIISLLIWLPAELKKVEQKDRQKDTA